MNIPPSACGTAENFFKCDPAHYKPEVGALRLNAELVPVALPAVRQQTALLAAPTTPD